MTDPKLTDVMHSLDDVVLWLRLPHDVEEHDCLLTAARRLMDQLEVLILDAAMSGNSRRVRRKRKETANVIQFPRNPRAYGIRFSG